tara:strand:- start:997 stop:1254 length:258 start_codon:yes stop_codon:yes gene_type:complete
MPVIKKSNEVIKSFHQLAHLRQLPNVEKEKEQLENPRRDLLSSDGQKRSGLILEQEKPVEQRPKRNNTVDPPRGFPVRHPKLQKK